MQAVEFKTYLCDDILTKVDRSTMSVGLEAREPLIDHKIAEYIANVPINLKYKNGESKYILRKIKTLKLKKTYNIINQEWPTR